MTAGLVKFSLAISSMFSCWRRRSCSMASAISGSTCCKLQFGWRDSWFHLVHAALVAAAFELRAQERIHDFAGQLRAGWSCRPGRGRWRRCAGARARPSARRTPARRGCRGPCWRRCSCRCRWCRPAGRIRPCASATLCADRLGVIGIIRGFLGMRAEIRDGSRRAPARCCLSGFLQLEAAVVRAEGDGRPACRRAPAAAPGACSMNLSSEAMPCSIWSRQFR